MKTGRVRERAARVCGAALSGALLGCGSAGDATAPDQPEEVAVQYSMEQSEFQPHSDLPPNLIVIMTLRNTATSAATRTFPAGCPVALRIYRGLDDALLYDETRLACSLNTSATLQVLPGQSRTIGSGFRQMTAIMGDSIPCGRYRLVGVPLTEGATLTEVEVGEVFLRAYPEWPASNPDAVYQC